MHMGLWLVTQSSGLIGQPLHASFPSGIPAAIVKSFIPYRLHDAGGMLHHFPFARNIPLIAFMRP